MKKGTRCKDTNLEGDPLNWYQKLIETSEMVAIEQQ